MRALRLLLCSWAALASTCLRESTIEPVRETVMVHGMAQVGSTSIGIAVASVSPAGLPSPASGATVTLRRGETGVVLTQAGPASSFCFAPSEFGFEAEAECYAAVLGEAIESGETLALDIELADGTRIVGRTTAPMPPVLEQPQPGSELEIEFFFDEFFVERSPIEVRWSGTGGPADLLLSVDAIFDDGSEFDCPGDDFFGGVLHSRSPAHVSAPYHCAGNPNDQVWDSAYVDLSVVGYDDNARAYIAATEDSGAGLVLDGASPGLELTAGDALVSGVFGSAARTTAALTLRSTVASGSRANGARGRGAAAPGSGSR